MNCQQLLIGLAVVLFLIPYVREGYQHQDYKVYKQSSDSLIPKKMYRMQTYPYEWAYRANNFPLEYQQPTQQETAPTGACLTEGALWTCSI